MIQEACRAYEVTSPAIFWYTHIHAGQRILERGYIFINDVLDTLAVRERVWFKNVGFFLQFPNFDIHAASSTQWKS